ncbi:hypothetical protein LP417_35370 (plasmid) [Polaromonas sp. P1-6]|nr:hypothetical protein LP417_35370 [Polaromonas sp. P1-6]
MQSQPKPYDELLAWLVKHGAKETGHGQRNLLKHLESTYAILKAAGQQDAVCVAGLFHSVYGTSSFKIQTVSFDDRDSVRALIGERSEQLAWLFCKLDRSSALQLHVEKSQLRLPIFGGGDMGLEENSLGKCLSDLLTIEAANLLEQQVLWRSQWLIPHAKACGVLTKQGDGPLPNSHVHENRMLSQARSALLQQLAVRVNAKRQQFASYFWWGDNVRAMKTMQAHQVLLAGGAPDGMDVRMVDNYAQVNGMALLDAAQEIVERAGEFQEALIQSELAKDAMTARIKKTTTSKELSSLRAEIMLI